jgi:hydroxymethylpyrimidine/phosphomethylpyrimidine kinase
VTPNLDEAERLLGSPISGVEALTDAAIALAARYNTAFLVKGGHLVGEETTDVMATPAGTTHSFRGKRVTGVNTHGTGCTLSAAITAGLAAGVSLPNAIDSAVTYVQRTIATHHRWMKINGEPIDALNHFPRPLDNENG